MTLAVARILLEGLGLGDYVEDKVDGPNDVQLDYRAPNCTLGLECLRMEERALARCFVAQNRRKQCWEAREESPRHEGIEQ